ncbi:MAG TPA: cysteine desulfurase NifS [Methanosarcinales archaeon]|nr:cysteine desulfurase NifS [Methanosarcinales archaeon]
MKRIYMDHGATSRVDPEVVKAMQPYFTEYFGNASSLHSFGREAKKVLEDSRETVANFIGAKKNEIIFTAGGTESDNMAIKGVAYKNRKKGNHIITSAIEHPAVIETCKYLEKQGFEVTYLPVYSEGIIRVEDLENAIREKNNKTILITIMHANNEIGTIQPIEEIGEIAKEKDIYFHTDAVQSVGKIPVDVDAMNIDLLSISSHKIYGPKGVGALYIRKGTKIEAFVHGGGHEFGLRSTTENIPGIVGLAKAIELRKERMQEDLEKLTPLRDYLIRGVLTNIEESYLNGHLTQRLPNNANFYFKYIEGESLILNLDRKGIAASTGSACSSTKLEPSHVLLAIGLKPEDAHGSLRLTLGRENTKEEVEYVLEALMEVVEKLRAISPLAKGM